MTLTISFNKVSRTDRDGKAYRLVADAEQANDLYASTADPGAWEFRHPLFRRGEPLLLASIKRKTTPQSAQDGPQAASPTEDFETRTVAGWMREPPQHAISPPKETSMSSRPRVYGYNIQTGESITPGRPDDRPNPSRGSGWGSSIPQPSGRMPPPVNAMRFHPESSRPFSSSYRQQPPVYGESGLYPQPQLSPVDPLSGRLTALEDLVQRLVESLHNERVERVRSRIDYNSHLMQLTKWIADPTRKSLFTL